jgi:hypothetical protein
MKQPPDRVGSDREVETTAEDETAEIVWMIRQGSSAWTGPSPRAGQARWAQPAASGPRAWGGLRWAVAAVLFTGLILVSVTMVAIDATPGGIASVPRMVSDELHQRQAQGPPSPGPAPISPSPTPAPSPTGGASPHATPGGSGSVAQPEIERPTPTPSRSPNPGPGRPGGPSPSPNPSPSPRDE